ncbi:MAG: hypothetical protein CMK89_15385 [Pseudomonadales bacterium]|nr:hypothetical protein [Pseudomonadales bacterium]RLU00850.1 MAG: hypothetical protein D9N11_12415 [Ketobacter sp.]
MTCAFVAGTLCSVSTADVIDEQRFHVSGFATLGAVKGGDEDLGFIQGLYQEGVFDGDWSFKSNSNLGLQLDAAYNDRLSATLQLVARDRVENNLENSVDWAFLRYRATQSITFRAGRLGPNNYMLSDYRNIGFAYLWVRPPTEFYNILSFDHLDGLDIAYSTSAGTGTFRGSLQVGKTSSTFQRADTLYDVKIKPILSGTLVWENDEWQAQFSAATIEFDGDKYLPGTELLAEALEAASLLWPEAEAYRRGLESEGKRSKYYSLGLAYTPINWQIQSEISYINTGVDHYGTYRNGYLSIGRHIGPSTLYVMWAQAERGEDRTLVPPPPTVGLPWQPLLDSLQAGTQYLYDALQVDQHTSTLGIRWNIFYNLAAKAQWDYTRVDAYSGGFWDQRVIPTDDKSISTFTINLNYVF